MFWPAWLKFARTIGNSLADSDERAPNVKSPSVDPISIMNRNVFFLLVVLFHDFRRPAPPY